MKRLIVIILYSCSLISCSHQQCEISQLPLTWQTLAITSSEVNGKLKNTLKRQLRLNGFTIKNQAPLTLKILHTEFSANPAISGSDNIAQQSWLKLTVNYQLQIKGNPTGGIKTVREIRLLRSTYNQTLATVHEQEMIHDTLRQQVAKTIVRQLTNPSLINSICQAKKINC